MNASFASLVLWSLVRAIDPSPADVARLDAFAADVAAAVDAAPALPFEGPAAREASIAALEVIAMHESGLRESVFRCRVTGDQGRSISAYQLMAGLAWGGHSRAEICASNVLASQLALAVLTRQSRCTTPGGMFMGYASGSCARRSRAGREMCARWALVLAQVGIEGATCGTRKPLTWKDEER